ncbi:hypothetical protein HUG17_9386 [Dermatophagoides farinae]|uniref:Uncharacterized protein n=2 Tax=Dermatophagoides farinae TaxID=6954 RepID=A0A9D4NS44_DERFA|nr:uncharacterized protein LOC124497270 [Dermatophagoides farinae]KAH7638280.1 hypothetical protein HUG17_9386 [Dermatophagoides farinae]
MIRSKSWSIKSTYNDGQQVAATTTGATTNPCKNQSSKGTNGTNQSNRPSPPPQHQQQQQSPSLVANLEASLIIDPLNQNRSIQQPVVSHCETKTTTKSVAAADQVTEIKKSILKNPSESHSQTTEAMNTKHTNSPLVFSQQQQQRPQPIDQNGNNPYLDHDPKRSSIKFNQNSIKQQQQQQFQKPKMVVESFDDDQQIEQQNEESDDDELQQQTNRITTKPPIDNDKKKSNHWLRTKSLKTIQLEPPTKRNNLKASTTTTASAKSLQRIGSIGSRLLSSSPVKRKIDNRTIITANADDDDQFVEDIGDDEENDKPTNCHYTEMYRRLTSIDNIDSMVCLKNCHPKIIKKRSTNDETLFVTKKCIDCNASGSILIMESFNDRLLRNLIDYYRKNYHERLEKIAIHLDGTNTVKDSLRSFELFSEQFGESLRSFRLLTNHLDLSMAFVFNNTITATFLQMFYLHSDYYENLVEFEVLLTDQANLRFFNLFWNAFAERIMRLTIKIRHDMRSFNEFAIEIIDTLMPPERLNERREQLRALRLELIPISNQAITNDKIDLTTVLDSMGKLSREFRTVITDVSLVVDINYVHHDRLKLMQCLATFNLADTYHLTIHSNPNRPNSSNLSKMNLNFDVFASLKNLRHLSIDYVGLTNDDIDRLSRYCPNLQSLSLSCDNRVDKIAVNSIGKYLNRLRVLSIGPAFSYQQNRNGLYIDNESLIQLFNQIIMGSSVELSSYGFSSLRIIRLANCRIRIDPNNNDDVTFEHHNYNHHHQGSSATTRDLISHLRNVATTLRSDENFTLILENNRFRLPVEKSFNRDYDIPENVRVHWIYRPIRRETSL